MTFKHSEPPPSGYSREERATAPGASEDTTSHKGETDYRRGWDRLFAVLGTSFGLAYLPVAPGTWGTLPGVAVFLCIVFASPQTYHAWLIAAALAAFCVLTVALGPWAERYWKMKDPRIYVPDEVAGFLLTVLFFRTPDPLLTTAWAFAITRVMDILKLPPAFQLERLNGGWGILLDDLVSSIYAVILLHVLTWVFPLHWFGGSPVRPLGW